MSIHTGTPAPPPHIADVLDSYEKQRPATAGRRAAEYLAFCVLEARKQQFTDAQLGEATRVLLEHIEAEYADRQDTTS